MAKAIQIGTLVMGGRSFPLRLGDALREIADRVNADKGCTAWAVVKDGDLVFITRDGDGASSSDLVVAGGCRVGLRPPDAAPLNAYEQIARNVDKELAALGLDMYKKDGRP